MTSNLLEKITAGRDPKEVTTLAIRNADGRRGRIKRIENLDAFVNLHRLDLSCNLLTRLDNVGCLKRLTVLSLADNHISRLDGIEGLERLEELNLTGNRLQQVPRSLLYLRRLRLLRLGRNKIAELAEFEKLAGMKNLASLTVQGNPISSLPHCRGFLVYSLRTLEVLDGDVVPADERVECIARFGPVHTQQLQEEIWSLNQANRQATTNLEQVKALLQESKESVKKLEEENQRLQIANKELREELALKKEWLDVTSKRLAEAGQRIGELQHDMMDSWLPSSSNNSEHDSSIDQMPVGEDETVVDSCVSPNAGAGQEGQLTGPVRKDSTQMAEEGCGAAEDEVAAPEEILAAIHSEVEKAKASLLSRFSFMERGGLRADAAAADTMKAVDKGGEAVKMVDDGGESAAAIATLLNRFARFVRRQEQLTRMFNQARGERLACEKELQLRLSSTQPMAQGFNEVPKPGSAFSTTAPSNRAGPGAGAAVGADYRGTLPGFDLDSTATSRMREEKVGSQPDKQQHACAGEVELSTTRGGGEGASLGRAVDVCSLQFAHCGMDDEQSDYDFQLANDGCNIVRAKVASVPSDPSCPSEGRNVDGSDHGGCALTLNGDVRNKFVPSSTGISSWITVRGDRLRGRCEQSIDLDQTFFDLGGGNSQFGLGSRSSPGSEFSPISAAGSISCRATVGFEQGPTLTTDVHTHMMRGHHFSDPAVRTPCGALPVLGSGDGHQDICLPQEEKKQPLHKADQDARQDAGDSMSEGPFSGSLLGDDSKFSLANIDLELQGYRPMQASPPDKATVETWNKYNVLVAQEDEAGKLLAKCEADIDIMFGSLLESTRAWMEANIQRGLDVLHSRLLTLYSDEFDLLQYLRVDEGNVTLESLAHASPALQSPSHGSVNDFDGFLPSSRVMGVHEVLRDFPARSEIRGAHIDGYAVEKGLYIHAGGLQRRSCSPDSLSGWSDAGKNRVANKSGLQHPLEEMQKVEINCLDIDAVGEARQTGMQISDLGRMDSSSRVRILMEIIELQKEELREVYEQLKGCKPEGDNDRLGMELQMLPGDHLHDGDGNSRRAVGQCLAVTTAQERGVHEGTQTDQECGWMNGSSSGGGRAEIGSAVDSGTTVDFCEDPSSAAALSDTVRAMPDDSNSRAQSASAFEVGESVIIRGGLTLPSQTTTENESRRLQANAQVIGDATIIARTSPSLSNYSLSSSESLSIRFRLFNYDSENTD
ncbi:hypothetical protein CBR_g23771 [Chara braunii]|uniref:U2A'/phosphoprotein 32 family A C-terminal domain-containing protein n=1 Tax=Chara braunii TaxID=69332 RepID=A0A388JVM1_CHABU|nr:hypothetical protein CBR_g23771 [Chara braunii]|eukprot:GBG61813.1 hypothetical protein CBR_g23771 [Chara braunii]